MLNPSFETQSFPPNEAKSHILQSGHCHIFKERKNKDRNRTAWLKLIIVLILCIFFMIIEIIGGIIAKSISIQTDAAHIAADIVGYSFSILALYVSEKEPTRRMSFGFYRIEILGALFSIIIIWILTGVLVYLAILRVIYQEFEIDQKAMVITASFGVAFNIIMFFVLNTNCLVLKNHGHSHDLSYSHSPTKKNSTSLDSTKSNFTSIGISDNIPIENNKCDNNGKDSDNINIRAAGIHIIGDFIQSIGVFIAAIIIYFKPEYKIADPICTFIFSILVFMTTAPIIKDIFYVLMEAVPDNLNFDLIVNELCNIPNVKKAHNLHIWCLTMDKVVLSVHLAIEKDSDTQQVLKEANQILRSKYNLEKTTIQIEYFMDCMENCEQCKLPK